MQKIAISAAMVLLAGCTLDHGKIEGSIRDELKAKGVAMKSVTCPTGVSIKKGDQFDCSGEDDEGEKLTFHVEQTDSGGQISWKLEGAIINPEKLGDLIEKKIHEKADVKCPQKTRILKKDQSFTCDVTVEGQTHKVTLVAEDNDGNVKWKIDG